MSKIIKNPSSKYFTISDYATALGKARTSVYYLIETGEFKKDTDYKILSDNRMVILINQKTLNKIPNENRKMIS